MSLSPIAADVLTAAERDPQGKQDELVSTEYVLLDLANPYHVLSSTTTTLLEYNCGIMF